MTALERLEAKTMPEPNNGCLLYLGPLWGRNKYGCFYFNKRNIGAHQAAWILHFGQIPEGKKVCHKCDVPICVNPKHLFIGDQKENVVDAIDKGRFANSLKNLRPENGFKPSVLTPDLVREIRSSHERNFILQQRLGLKQQTVSAVRRRVIWKSLPD